MKPKTPFGQLPLLTTVQEEGTPPFHIAQTAAIINFVGKVSGMEGEVREERSDDHILPQHKH